jgi:hypothetical protein
LAVNNKTYYDYHFHHDLDPLKSEKKSNIDTLKEETRLTDAENNDSDFDEKPTFEQNANDYVDFTEIKNSKYVKLTNDSSSDDNYDMFDSAEELIDKITVEDVKIDTKSAIKYKSSGNSHKLKSEDLNEEVKDKFVMKVFTVEEMLRNREEKRNQPNFKKIPFKCDSCVLGFTRKENRDVHIKKKHNKVDLSMLILFNS